MRWLSLLVLLLALTAMVISPGTLKWIFLGIALLGLLAINCTFRNKRNVLLQRLRMRTDCDLDWECAQISKSDGIMTPPSAKRLWYGAADFYQLPAEKLRAADRLQIELSGLNGPDFDVCMTPLVRLTGGELATEFSNVRNWTDLIVLLRRCELKSGKTSTVKVSRGSDSRDVWNRQVGL